VLEFVAKFIGGKMTTTWMGVSKLPLKKVAEEFRFVESKLVGDALVYAKSNSDLRVSIRYT
jgi:hypothetical protein